MDWFGMYSDFFVLKKPPSFCIYRESFFKAPRYWKSKKQPKLNKNENKNSFSRSCLVGNFGVCK